MFNQLEAKCHLNWQLEKEDLDYFREKIAILSGISMKESKKELLSTRLRGRAQQLGLDSFSGYRHYLMEQAESSAEWQIFINLLTTNKTDFFREPKHFDFLETKFIPEWLTQNKKTLKVWSCASSTGEEPYTLAMVLERALPPRIEFQILATDIDTAVLARGANGVYAKSRLHEIPAKYHESSLCLGSGEVEPWFAIKKKLRDKITFQHFNLTSEGRPSEDEFDLVFCRNILIYFQKETIAHVAQKVFDQSEKLGVLVIGHAESLHGIRTQWKMVGPSIFRKDEGR